MVAHQKNEASFSGVEQRSEQRLAELEQERRELQQCLDIAGFIIVALDAKGRVTRINQKGCDLLGFTREEIVGKDWFANFLPRGYKTGTRAVYRRLMAGEIETERSSQNPVLTRSGEQRQIAWRNSIIRDERGRPAGTLSSGEDITDRKAAEEERDRILDLTCDLICIAGMDGYFKYVNPAWEKVLGYTREELLARPFLDFIHPDDHVRNDAEVARMSSGKATLDFENRYIGKDGSVRTISWRAVPLRRKRLMYCIGRDITERKLADQELADRLIYFRSMDRVSRSLALSENVDEMVERIVRDIFEIFSPDRSWLVYPCDPEAETVQVPFELARPEYPGGGVLKQDIQLDDSMRQVMRDLSDSDEPLSFDFNDRRWSASVMVKRFNVKSQLHVRVNPRRGKSWVLGMHQCSDVRVWSDEEKRLFKDISIRMADVLTHLLLVRDLSRSEDELRREKEFTESALDAQMDTFFVFEPETGTPIRWNRIFREISGYSDEEIAAMKAPDDWYDPEELKRAEKFTREVMERGRGRMELNLICKDGRRIPMEYAASLIRDADGLPGFITSVGRDITARRKVERALKQNLKEKEVLLREIHHRVKNNMQIMTSLLRLQAGGIQDPKIRAKFRESQDRIRSMALIHERLYRAEDMSRVDFSGYLDRMILHLISTYEGSRGRIRTEQDVRDVHLDINRAIPCGLLINELVSNALKHAFPGDRKGTILVRMHGSSDGRFELTVRDDGIGLPETFDLECVESLGLQLVNDLVLQLEGTIEIGLDHGAVFRVRF